MAAFKVCPAANLIFVVHAGLDNIISVGDGGSPHRRGHLRPGPGPNEAQLGCG